ncbi:MAG: hypothetical protein N2544_07680 [Burkholderiales bacterium]|nr:hypothetical protein [Burkholderiales bacterium]
MGRPIATGGVSRHARIRMQQRCVPADVVAQLVGFGTARHDHRGGVVVFFDKRSRRRLERAAGPEARRTLERWANAYAVVAADGAVVTVGRRDRRFRRN